MRAFATSAVTAIAPPIVLTLAGLLFGLVIRRTILARLARAASRTSTSADDAVVAALRGPVVLWCTVLGLYVGVQLAALPHPVGRIAQQILVVSLIVSMTWALSHLASDLVHARARSVQGALPSTNLITNLARAAVLTVGSLVILQALGISITPLITAFGVGGLAVGLALQDTLANLFAGIHILVSRQVRPGDFIRLSSGEEGYVQDVTWRYTTIRQLPNNLIIVPNSKLASGVTANFNLPDAEQAVLVDVGVSYASDLQQVEAVTVEVGERVMREVEGGVPGSEARLRVGGASRTRRPEPHRALSIQAGQGRAAERAGGISRRRLRAHPRPAIAPGVPHLAAVGAADGPGAPGHPCARGTPPPLGRRRPRECPDHLARGVRQARSRVVAAAAARDIQRAVLEGTLVPADSPWVLFSTDPRSSTRADGREVPGVYRIQAFWYALQQAERAAGIPH